MLFDKGLTYTTKGRWGKNVSDWFNGDTNGKGKKYQGYKIACGFQRNSTKVFHSFRKSFGHCLIDKGCQHNHIGALIGHESLKVSDSNPITFEYTGGFPLHILKESIEILSYDDVNLDHISYQNFLSKSKK